LSTKSHSCLKQRMSFFTDLQYQRTGHSRSIVASRQSQVTRHCNGICCYVVYQKHATGTVYAAT
jgi:hypothetical protein